MYRRITPIKALIALAVIATSFTSCTGGVLAQEQGAAKKKTRTWRAVAEGDGPGLEFDIARTLRIKIWLGGELLHDITKTGVPEKVYPKSIPRSAPTVSRWPGVRWPYEEIEGARIPVKIEVWAWLTEGSPLWDHQVFEWDGPRPAMNGGGIIDNTKGSIFVSYKIQPLHYIRSPNAIDSSPSPDDFSLPDPEDCFCVQVLAKTLHPEEAQGEMNGKE